ncbi:DUF2491 family protein [uncultured Sphingomonas sp.]|uniref:DUF2491 family protein n=1 Tax=uncultured Sphingomonas sp. TaxID=158754 RepID=UPI0035CA21A4
MFDRLFGRPRAPAEPALAAARNVTIGRTVVLDPLAWRRFGGALLFPFDGDTLQIVAQGIVELDGGGFIHRFYTDDDIMLQAVSDDREAAALTDVTLFAPWRSIYPSSPWERPAWRQRLTAASFTDDGLPEYRRLWFGDEAVRQEPVTFWEDLHDDRDGIVDRRIYQTCMLFGRDVEGDGRELLLAIDMETEAREVSFEIMIGMALELGEFRA